MPVVPTYESPKVESRGPSLSGFSADTRTGAEQVSASVSGFGRQVDEVYAKARHEADAQAITAAETAFQAAANKTLHDPQSGLMYKQGDEAFKASGEAMDGLSKAREDIAEKMLQTESQRRLFNARSGSMLEDYHRQIDTHAGQQLKVAQQATVNARVEQGLDAVANSYADSETAAKQLVALEGPIRAFQLSKEDGDAKVAALHQKVAEVRLNQAIASQDVGFASSFFAQAKDTLGEKAAHYQHIISTMQGQVSGRTTAASMLKVATNADSGLVDEAKLTEALSMLPPDYPHYKDVQEALVPMREAAERSNRALINGKYTEAFSVLERTGSLNGVKPDTMTWLGLYAPDKLHELRQKQRELAGRDANAPPTPSESAAYGDALKDLNENRYQWMDKSAQDVVGKYAGALSPKDLHTLVTHFAELKKSSDLDRLPAPEAAAVQRVFQDEMGLPAQQKAWGAEQVERFHKVLDLVKQQRASELKKAKGTEPTQEQLDEWVHKALVRQPVPNTGVSVLGHTFFQKKVPAIDAQGGQQSEAAPPPGAKKGTDGKYYLRNARGKWEPVNG